MSCSKRDTSADRVNDRPSRISTNDIAEGNLVRERLFANGNPFAKLMARKKRREQILSCAFVNFLSFPKLGLKREGDATPDHTEVVVRAVQEMPAKISHYADVPGKAIFQSASGLSRQNRIFVMINV